MSAFRYSRLIDFVYHTTLRLIDFVYHSTLGLRVIKTKKSVSRVGDAVSIFGGEHHVQPPSVPAGGCAECGVRHK